MNALHTHFLSPEGDLALLENYLETARRERQIEQPVCRSMLSRLAFLGIDNEWNRKREIYLSLLKERIG